MRRILAICAAAIAGLSASSTAQAQAHHHGDGNFNHHHHGGQVVVPSQRAPIKMVALTPEVVAQFEHDGATYTVINTHQRGLFWTEGMLIADSKGNTVGGWWTTRGQCFTKKFYEGSVCMSQGQYRNLFKTRLTSTTMDLDIKGDYGKPYELCDHYTKLEYTISGDTSGVCGY